jgi:hypothetical protein
MDVQRITIRSVDVGSVERLRRLRRITRLPLGALMENAVNELWEWYEQNGWHMDDPHASVEPGSPPRRPQSPPELTGNGTRVHA